MADPAREQLFETPPIIRGTACEGCGVVKAVQIILPVLGPRTVVAVPASCLATIGASPTHTSWKVPFIHSLFETAPALTTGLRAAYNALGKGDINVVTFAGDSATLDIGLQALSGQAARNDDVIHICFDNEVAMNTGGQASGASPRGAITATTPLGVPWAKKDGPAIMAAHAVPYVATGSISHPDDLADKIRRAMEIEGMRYLHVLTPCPLSWRYDWRRTEEVASLAVEAGLWVLYEVVAGERHLTYVPRQRKPVDRYLLAQGRFHHLTEAQRSELQRLVDDVWRDLDAGSQAMGP